LSILEHEFWKVALQKNEHDHGMAVRETDSIKNAKIDVDQYVLSFMSIQIIATEESKI